MCRQLGGLVKSIDMYGHKIQLNYKGESTNKTFFGGMLSLVSLFLVIGYFALLLLDLRNNESTVKTIVSYIDYSKEGVDFDQKQFDIAIQVKIWPYTQFGNTSRYITFYAYTMIQMYDPIELTYGHIEQGINEGDCGYPERMQGDQFYKDQRKIYQWDTWFCLEDNYTSSLQTNAKNLVIEMQPCFGDDCEKDPNMIKSFLNQASIRVYKTSKFFDIQEFVEFPVKTVVDVQEFFLSSQFSKQLDFRLALNKAEGSTSRLAEQFDKFDYQFLYSEFEMEQIKDLSPAYYTKLIFKISSEEVKVERKNNNFVEVLSKTGGIMGIVIAFFAIIGSSIQELLFFSMIISDIFLTEERVREGSQDKQNSKCQRSNPRDESYKFVGSQEQQLEGGEEDNFDSLSQKSRNNPTISKSKSKSFVFVEGDPNSYIGLIRLLQSRKPFQYVFKDGFRDFIRTYFCCCMNNRRVRLRKQLYSLAKEKIQKQLDISNIIKQMKVLKLVQRVYLSRYQRKLVPFFKKNMLSNKLLRQKEKQEKTMQKNKNVIREGYLQDIATNMIELFTDCKEQNPKSMKILDNILGRQSKPCLPNRTLEQKLFSGIMRKSLVRAMLIHDDQQIDLNSLPSNQNNGNEIKSKANQRDLNIMLNTDEDNFEIEVGPDLAEIQKGKNIQQNQQNISFKGNEPSSQQHSKNQKISLQAKNQSKLQNKNKSQSQNQNIRQSPQREIQLQNNSIDFNDYSEENDKEDLEDQS
eukprot:403373351